MIARAFVCAAALIALSPAAHANSAAVDYFRTRADRTAVPILLTEEERGYYHDLFGALDRRDWGRVRDLLAAKADGPLHQEALAQYYLGADSPKVDLDTLDAWLMTSADLPQAEQIGRLAARRGATDMPALPGERPMVQLPSLAKRIKPRAIDDGTMPASVAAAIALRIRNDDPAGARQLLDGIDAGLSSDARAQWRQTVAWSYYIENDDASAYQLAQAAGLGTGPWLGEAWWTAGLAAWRLGDCDGAGAAFAHAADAAGNAELAAAALYWQSRAAVRCRKPEDAARPLLAAARKDETLYGMLAAEQLGIRLPAQHASADFTLGDWQVLRDVANVRVAVELSEIGEDGLADEVLRHQARIGSPAQYAPLTRLARDLGLPSTQLWMAYNAPSGALPEPATRFPTPKWTPAGGWTVDPALVYAHTLQESVFRTGVVSAAGARGLMQIMPAAAKDHAAGLGVTGGASDLNDPEVNLAFGQRHLGALRDAGCTKGLLLKVIAAYNAGPVPVSKWNADIHDGGDPLLWMESVPFWETRGYVNIVLRNYWMYERQAGGASDSRIALAQGLWPTFPGLVGSQAMRVAANGAMVRVAQNAQPVAVRLVMSTPVATTGPLAAAPAGASPLPPRLNPPVPRGD